MHDTQLVHRNGLPRQNSNRRFRASTLSPSVRHAVSAPHVTQKSHWVSMLTP